MLKIGEFSKITQVSVKTLRYYDALGLLKPAVVNRYNGYRYYTLSQLPRLNRILALKDLAFSLDQIQELLAIDLPGPVLETLLKNKADELRERIGDEQSRLLRVENHLRQLTQTANARPIPVVLKTAPYYLVATIRQVLPSVNDLRDWQAEQLSLIHHYLTSINQPPQGPELLIYHQNDYQETDLDVEIGTIIQEAGQAAAPRPTDSPVQIRTLAGVVQMVTATQAPNAGSRSETYARLAQWAQSNAFFLTGSWRELIYRQTEPKVETIVEVQRPVVPVNQYYTSLELSKMEPKIIKKEPFTLVGMRYFGKNENREIPMLWGEFNQRVPTLNGLPHATGEAAIGLCTTPEDEPQDGAFEYVAGLPVTQVEDLPEGFVVREVPAYTYAVFAHKGDIKSLGTTYEYIYESWLPQSGYHLAAKLDFEYYNDEFKDFAPDSVFYIYLPIEKD